MDNLNTFIQSSKQNAVVFGSTQIEKLKDNANRNNNYCVEMQITSVPQEENLDVMYSMKVLFEFPLKI